MASFALANAKTCTFAHDKCRNTRKFRINEIWLFSIVLIVYFSYNFPHIKTADFIAAGQNIYMESTTGSSDSISNIIGNMTKDWFESEYPNGEYYGYMDMINQFPEDTDPDMYVVELNYQQQKNCFFHLLIFHMKFFSNFREIGHFTQIVADDAYQVGCAAVQYDSYEDGYTWTNTYYVCDYSRTNIEDSPVYVTGKAASGCKSGTNPQYSALCSVNEKYGGVWYYPNNKSA